MKILFFIRVNDSGEIKRSDFRDIISRLVAAGDRAEVYDTATARHYSVICGGSLRLLSSGIGRTGSRYMLYMLRLKALFSFSRRHRRSYDVAHFCYVREEFLLLSSPLLKVAKKNIITVFGSDLGKRNIVKRLFRRFVYRADIITVTATNGLDLLKRHFAWRRLEGHVRMIPVPLSVMKALESSLLTREEARAKLGLSPDDCLVVCGSVLSPNEQYGEWVPLLRNVSMPGRNPVFLFPFTYGDMALLDAYRQLIRSSLPEGSYRIITGWITEEETVTLRKATDVLINLRRTDQFAGIIMESLFTGASVITGSWLGYGYYAQNGVWLYRIDSFSGLPAMLERAVAELVSPEAEVRRNTASEVLGRDFGYGSVTARWDKFYDEIRRGTGEADS